MWLCIKPSLTTASKKFSGTFSPSISIIHFLILFFVSLTIFLVLSKNITSNVIYGTYTTSKLDTYWQTSREGRKRERKCIEVVRQGTKVESPEEFSLLQANWYWKCFRFSTMDRDSHSVSAQFWQWPKNPGQWPCTH